MHDLCLDRVSLVGCVMCFHGFFRHVGSCVIDVLNWYGRMFEYGTSFP